MKEKERERIVYICLILSLFRVMMFVRVNEGRVDEDMCMCVWQCMCRFVLAVEEELKLFFLFIVAFERLNLLV